ncbi:MFS transporter [Pseudokineococcus sp. 1T1Z-3]|uniref:MFS transporter n=1 Tax=Pseudokineococcus sp. 1T1Z-3 TaxID=3132745 RepID=UPI0030B66F85
MHRPPRRRSPRERWRAGLLGAPEGRDYRRLWVGDGLTGASVEVTGLLVPLLAVGVLQASPLEMGLLEAAQTLAFLLVGLPAGAWVDRWRKRSVLLWSNLLRGGALLLLPLAWALDVLSLPLVLVVAALVGVGSVFFDVASQSYLPSLVPARHLAEGNAKLQVLASLAQVAGPALGGLLARLLGAPLALLAAGATFLVAVAGPASIAHREEPAPREPGRTLRAEVAEGLAFVVHRPLLRRIVATTSASNAFGAITSALLVLYAVRELGLTEAQVGLAFSVGAVGGLAGALVAEKVTAWAGEGRTIAWSLVPALPALALLPLASGRETATALVMVSVSGAVGGVGIVVYNVAQVTFRQRLCPRPLLGRMNASVRFVVWGVMPVGAFLGGVLGEQVGLVAALWISVAGQALGVLPVLLSPLARSRDLPGVGEGP